METNELAIVERWVVKTLLKSGIWEVSLKGHCAAWAEWIKGPTFESEPWHARQTAYCRRIVAKLLAVIPESRVIEGFDPEILHVQANNYFLNNYARKHLHERFGQAQAFVDSDLPVPYYDHTKNVWPWEFGRSYHVVISEDNPWREMLSYLTPPDWNMMIRAWAALTPAIRAMVDVRIGNAPIDLNSAKAMAWLDWVAMMPTDPEWVVDAAFRHLPADDMNRLCENIIEQGEVWSAVPGLWSDSAQGKTNNAVHVILSWFCVHCGQPNKDIMARIYKLKVWYPYSKRVLSEKVWQGRLENTYPQSHQLVMPSEVSEPSSAVKAGHGELIHVEGETAPLMVLLDLDLTHPDLAHFGSERDPIPRLRLVKVSKEKLCHSGWPQRRSHPLSQVEKEDHVRLEKRRDSLTPDTPASARSRTGGHLTSSGRPIGRPGKICRQTGRITDLVWPKVNSSRYVRRV